MAGSTDVALETADVVLLDGGLAKLDRAFQISDEAMANVRQNLGIIIVPNAIAILLGAFGFIGPPMAAIINNGATFLAVAAGTIPLLKRKPERKPGPDLENPDREPSSNAGKFPGAPATMPNRSRLQAAAGGGKG